MNKSLVKTAAAHRRLARRGLSRLRAALRNGQDVTALVKHVDANRRCSAMDFAAAREVMS